MPDESDKSDKSAKNPDLHGNVPENSRVALLLIDVINDMEWPGGEQLLPHALAAARNIAALKRRCRDAGIPALYVNDNFGRWQSDFGKLVSHCCGADDGADHLAPGRTENGCKPAAAGEVRGRAVSRVLRPDEAKDFFALKPKHSGFFSTTLDTLLEYLGAKTLILTGFTADVCVLFTANDAYMRDFHLFIPRDCVASLDERENAHALEHMKRVLKADTRPSAELDLEGMKK